MKRASGMECEAFTRAVGLGDRVGVARALSETPLCLNDAVVSAVRDLDSGRVPFHADVFECILRARPDLVAAALTRGAWRHTELVARALADSRCVRAIVASGDDWWRAPLGTRVAFPRALRLALDSVLAADDVEALEALDSLLINYRPQPDMAPPPSHAICAFGPDQFLMACVKGHHNRLLAHGLRKRVVRLDTEPVFAAAALRAAVEAANVEAVALLASSAHVDAGADVNCKALTMLVEALERGVDLPGGVVALRRTLAQPGCQPLAGVLAQGATPFVVAALCTTGHVALLEAVKAHVEGTWRPAPGPFADPGLFSNWMALIAQVEAGVVFPAPFWGVALVKAARQQYDSVLDFVLEKGTFTEADLVNAAAAAVASDNAWVIRRLRAALPKDSDRARVTHTAIVTAAAVGNMALIELLVKHWDHTWGATLDWAPAIAATTLCGHAGFNAAMQEVAARLAGFEGPYCK